MVKTLEGHDAQRLLAEDYALQLALLQKNKNEMIPNPLTCLS